MTSRFEETPTQGGPSARPGITATIDGHERALYWLGDRGPRHDPLTDRPCTPDDLRAAGWVPAGERCCLGFAEERTREANEARDRADGYAADLDRTLAKLASERARADAAEKQVQAVCDTLFAHGWGGDGLRDSLPAAIERINRSLENRTAQYDLEREAHGATKKQLAAAEKRAEAAERMLTATAAAREQAERERDEAVAAYGRDVEAMARQRNAANATLDAVREWRDTVRRPSKPGNVITRDFVVGSLDTILATPPADDAKPAASEQPDGWSGSWCPQCGPDVRVDEDGCCLSCGCDAVGNGAEQALAMRLALKRKPPSEQGRREGVRLTGEQRHEFARHAERVATVARNRGPSDIGDVALAVWAVIAILREADAGNEGGG